MKKRNITNVSASKKPRTSITKKAQTNDIAVSFPRYKSLASLGKGFPQKVTMSHRYCELQQLSAGASPNALLFSCNGLFKPNQSAAGHQPYYFDQLTAVYNHYRVMKAKITLSISPQNTGQVATYFSLTSNDDTTVTNNTVFGQVEQQDARYGILAAGSTDRVVILTARYDAYKVFGRNRDLASLMASDWLQGTISANPTETYNWVLLYDSLDGTSVCTVNVVCDIQYDCIWDEVKEVSTS